ncbi:hypothetical protein E2C01_075603 [Portunus trituberculatus]|uniref:Uncharacterized protein n=1 Tax=Portunus trituberculatus TaxID=210409 RepID=A0A5B7IB36_PORTR|nr:hypothetical protein [Portunus trituberculatus]
MWDSVSAVHRVQGYKCSSLEEGACSRLASSVRHSAMPSASVTPSSEGKRMEGAPQPGVIRSGAKLARILCN